jgi:hypothetical protein
MTYLSACYSARACVQAGSRVRGRVHECVRVALISQHATCMRHIVTSFAASLAPPHFLTFSHKRRDFRTKVTEYKIQLLSRTFLIVGRI